MFAYQKSGVSFGFGSVWPGCDKVADVSIAGT